MSKERFDLMFDQIFEETVQKSLELTPPTPSQSIKKSWETISKHIEQYCKAN
jgi:hypothetical protein